MEITKARKIGFFSALSICFSSIVGVGIFLKNASVGKNVDGNGYAWLTTWIVAGVLALLLAYHFGKISKIESKSNLSGLTSWTNEIFDKKNKWFKNLTMTNYGVFYNPILSICLSFFTAEFFIEFLRTINPNIINDLWIHALITLIFLSFFILNNYFSHRISGYISVSTSILKFIPLLMVIFIGIIFLNTHNSSDSNNGFNQEISFEKALQGIVLSMPSVFFAFDSFIGVGAWSKQIKGGEKSVSKVIVIAMILVTVIYSLVCLASIFHYTPQGTTVVNVLIDSLPQNAKTGLTVFVSLFIFISAFGTSNSICGTTIHEFKNMIITKKMLFLSNRLEKKFGLEKSSLFMSIIILASWFLVLVIPSMIINNDALIDGFSNLVVIYIFLIYSYTIYMFWKNIYKNNSEFKQGTNEKVYAFLVWIALIGTSIIALLNIFYVFFDAISDPFGFANWGLFLTGQSFSRLTNVDVLIIYLIFSLIFFIFPTFSKYLNNKSKWHSCHFHLDF